MNLMPLLEERILILDGGIGTEILKRTGKSFGCPELLNVTEGDIIFDIHEAYIRGGADILTTNTFGGTRIKLDDYSCGDRVEVINSAGVAIAKKARRGKKQILIAGSMGPTGRLIAPLGKIEEKQAYDAYAEQAGILARAGADFLLIETQIDTLEARIAYRAARDSSSLPVALTFSFPMEGGLTVTGSDPDAAVLSLASTDIDIIGINCGGHPDDFKPYIERFRAHTDKPLMVYANAGIPEKKGDGLVYPLGPEAYAEHAVSFFELGANVIGGCCGTTAEHIRLITKKLKGKKPRRRKPREVYFRSSSRNSVFFAGGPHPFRSVGENINPFGRKALSRDLDKGRLKLVRDLARSQEQAGADALDVNLGKDGERKPKFYCSAIKELQTVGSLPLFLDNSRSESLEEALFVYAGKAVVNSVNGKKESYETLFPLAKKYGAGLILLAMDDTGIPQKSKDRIRIIERLVDRAISFGFGLDDLLADPLVLTVSTSQQNAVETLDTLEGIKSLGLSTIMGLSNVSFGLPRRTLINQAFLIMALERGLDAAILNPLDEALMSLSNAGGALSGRDPGFYHFIQKFGKREEIPAREIKDVRRLPTDKALFQAIVEGEKNQAVTLTRRLLKEGHSGLEILENILAPALRKVGEYYKNKHYFLPQLVLSAEATEAASKVLEAHLKISGKAQKRLKIVMATVEGDLHDIGKNIVCLVLRNYGYEVFDMGKNVGAEAIVKKAVGEEAQFIGLSALMTTTMDAMNEVVFLKNRLAPQVRVLVGGAAVTPAFARGIGADAYGKDALDAIRKIEALAGRKK